MTLLISALTALIFAFLWYFKDYKNKFHLGTMAIIFGAASLMWLVDAIYEYATQGAEVYFNPSVQSILNDALLGLAVVALGLIIWFIILLIKDPMGYRKKKIEEKKE